MCGGTAGVSRRLLRRSGKRWNEIEQTKKMMEGIQTQNFTVETATGLIDSLADLTGTGVSKKITFGARNKAKLSAAQLALVTDKGWTIG